MLVTYVTKDNEDSFLGILGEEERRTCAIRIGAVDEKTDTACGLLAAEAVDENTIAIRFCYVDEAFRRQGAARAMIRALQDTASNVEAEHVLCTYLAPEEGEDAIKNLLEATGFSPEPDPEPVFHAAIANFCPPEKDGGYTYKSLYELSKKEWNAFYPIAGANENPPEAREVYDEICSVFAYDAEGAVKGGILVKKVSDGILIEGVSTASQKESDLWHPLLQACILRSKSREDSFRNIYVLPRRKIMERMLNDVFGKQLQLQGHLTVWSWEAPVIG